MQVTKVGTYCYCFPGHDELGRCTATQQGMLISESWMMQNGPVGAEQYGWSQFALLPKVSTMYM